MIFTRVFSKIEFFLKNFSEFTGKDLSQSLFFNKIAGLAIGKDVLLWICKFFKNNLFTKRLRVLQYYVLCPIFSIMMRNVMEVIFCLHTKIHKLVLWG